MKSMDIPHDVVMQILARIPFKSLMRFMCVCKLWYSTIRDPYFAELHWACFQTGNRSNYITNISYCQHQIRICLVDDGEGQRPGLQSNAFNVVKPNCPQLLATPPLQGLVCFHCPHLYHNPFVLNLSTHQIVTLPSTSFRYIYDRCMCFLGFDPAAKEYKVVNIIFGLPYYLAGRSCEIYTLGTESRRIIEDPPRGSITISEGSTSVSSCVNGAIYWMDNFNGRSSIILVFDVGKEVFRIIKLSESVHWGNLLDLGGEKLAILRFAGCISMWILEKDYENHDVVLVKEKIDFPCTLRVVPRFSFGSISPTGEIFIPDTLNSRNIYLNLQRKTLRIQHFESLATRKDHNDECLRLQMAFYNHIENIVRFRDSGST